MKIFNEERLHAYLEELTANMLREVQNEAEGQILGLDEDEYLTYLTDKYTPEEVEVNWAGITASTHSKVIDPRELPSDIRTFSRQPFPADVVRFHFPVVGNERLLRCRPSSAPLAGYDVSASCGELTFDVINPGNDERYINKQKDGFVTYATQLLDAINKDIAAYHGVLRSQAGEAVMQRKRKLIDRNAMLERLAVPIRKVEEVPSAFQVPVQPKKVAVKPKMSAHSPSGEPLLEEAIYQDIVKIIWEFGTAMERHPSTYSDRDEESLRDLFLLLLTPHFHSATGETFNRGGKTDILIRHEDKNAFVAECKIWRGPSEYAKGIDQLLGNLTWRDSKSALIVFVKNQKLDPVLSEISARTPEHKCFDGKWTKISEGHYRCQMHLLDDDTRNVHVTVLCFHFPVDYATKP